LKKDRKYNDQKKKDRKYNVQKKKDKRAKREMTLAIIC
jgi:hypothetical protein